MQLPTQHKPTPLDLLRKNAPVIYQLYIPIKIKRLEERLVSLRTVYSLQKNEYEKHEIEQEAKQIKEELVLLKSGIDLRIPMTSNSLSSPQ